MPLFRRSDKESEKETGNRCIRCGAILRENATYCIKCFAPQTPVLWAYATTFEIVDWRNVLTIKEGEYVVLESNPNVDDLNYRYRTKGLAQTLSDCGFVLTNQRLVILSFKPGEKKDGKTPILFELQKEFPLESIKDVTYTEDLPRRISIYTAEGKYDCGVLWPTVTGLKPDKGQDYAARSLARFNYFREKIIEQKEKKATVTLDFSSLKSIMEKGGIVLTTLSCPKCNAPLRIPTNGNEMVCRHCGSTVYAQDVFRKIKTLLG